MEKNNKNNSNHLRTQLMEKIHLYKLIKYNKIHTIKAHPKFTHSSFVPITYQYNKQQSHAQLHPIPSPSAQHLSVNSSSSTPSFKKFQPDNNKTIIITSSSDFSIKQFKQFNNNIIKKSISLPKQSINYRQRQIKKENQRLFYKIQEIITRPTCEIIVKKQSVDKNQSSLSIQIRKQNKNQHSQTNQYNQKNQKQTDSSPSFITKQSKKQKKSFSLNQQQIQQQNQGLLKRLMCKKPTISTTKILDEYKKNGELKKRLSRFKINTLNIQTKLDEDKQNINTNNIDNNENNNTNHIIKRKPSTRDDMNNNNNLLDNIISYTQLQYNLNIRKNLQSGEFLHRRTKTENIQTISNISQQQKQKQSLIYQVRQFRKKQHVECSQFNIKKQRKVQEYDKYFVNGNDNGKSKGKITKIRSERQRKQDMKNNYDKKTQSTMQIMQKQSLTAEETHTNNINDRKQKQHISASQFSVQKLKPSSLHNKSQNTKQNSQKCILLAQLTQKIDQHLSLKIKFMRYPSYYQIKISNFSSFPISSSSNHKFSASSPYFFTNTSIIYSQQQGSRIFSHFDYQYKTIINNIFIFKITTNKQIKVKVNQMWKVKNNVEMIKNNKIKEEKEQYDEG